MSDEGFSKWDQLLSAIHPEAAAEFRRAREHEAQLEKERDNAEAQAAEWQRFANEELNLASEALDALEEIADAAESHPVVDYQDRARAVLTKAGRR